MAIELTDAQERLWRDYQELGTPDEIRRKRTDLVSDNGKQRDKLRDAHAETDRLNTELREARKKVPDGGQVLTADEAKAFKTYQELGKPEDLKTEIQAKKDLESKVANRDRMDRIGEVAEVVGYKADVLGELPGAEKLKFELREETVDGEKVQVAYVTTEDQGATPQKLEDYVDANWKAFIPALEAEAAEEHERGSAEQRRMVRQTARGKPTKVGAADVEKVKEAKSRNRRYASL